MEISLKKALQIFSPEIGILSNYVDLPKFLTDSKMFNFGVMVCNSQYLNGEKFDGRSGGCGYSWENTMLSTIGETVERYACAFYDKSELLYSSLKELGKPSIPIDSYALFHEEQHKEYERLGFSIKQFDENLEVSWFPTIDLTTGKETWIPGQFIYIPFTCDSNYITVNTSTGLAAHTDVHKAILNALYECIERDSFSLTWIYKIVPPKINISQSIRDYIDNLNPHSYQWHFFDVTFDLQVPTVFGLCFGQTEFGQFVAVGSATRGTMGEALKKVIQEIGQAIPYFRWLELNKTDTNSEGDFNKILSFEDHSVFYLKRQHLWSEAFDEWVNADEYKEVDINEARSMEDIEEIKSIIGVFRRKNYNVLFSIYFNS